VVLQLLMLMLLVVMILVVLQLVTTRGRGLPQGASPNVIPLWKEIGECCTVLAAVSLLTLLLL
jgi:hypothetical protein